VRRSGDTVALAVKTPADTAAPALAVLVPDDTDKPAQVLSPSGAGMPGDGLELDTVRGGAAARLALAGRAAPGARLNIYAEEQLLGTATADLNGKWTLTAPRGQLPSAFELRLDQLADDGRVIRRVAAPVTPPPVTTGAHAAHDYIVRQGNNLWLIARHVYGDGVRFTAIYTANRGQIRDPDMIYPGQHFHLPRS